MQKLAVIIKKSGLEVSFPNPGQVPAKKKNRESTKLQLRYIGASYPSQPGQHFDGRIGKLGPLKVRRSTPISAR